MKTHAAQEHSNMKNKSLFRSLLAGGALFFFLAVFYFSFLSGQSYVWDDALYLGYPGASYLSTSLASGHIPLWASGVRDGVPFVSDLAMAAMYPPLWGLTLFVSGGVLPYITYQWYLVLQLLMGGAFTVAFLRLIGLRYRAALSGAIVFMFSAHMSLHLVHPNLFRLISGCHSRSILFSVCFQSQIPFYPLLGW